MSEDSSSLVASHSGVRYGGAIVLGLAMTAFHWLGILLGGVLIGLVAPNTRRALLYGAVWGVFVGAVSVVWLGLAGIGPSMAAGQLWGVSLGAALVLGTIGGSARELRPLVRELVGD